MTEYEPDTRTQYETVKDHYRQRHTANMNPFNPNPKRHELYSFPSKEGDTTTTIQLYQIAVMLHDIRRMLTAVFYAACAVGAFKGVLLMITLWRHHVI